MSIASEDLSDHINQQISVFLPSNQTVSILIGYSGGLDSTVLLHALAGLSQEIDAINLLPIHINHGVSQFSINWVEHCQSFCEKLNISLAVFNACLEQVKTNREAEYRRVRYAVFADQMQENDLLLTAHHQQDQVETILFNLFRGGGLSGLRGMEAVRKFSSGHHIRPLLSLSPDCLINYARHHKLSWIEDPSNKDVEMDRNYIRHTILPLINDRWPSSVSSISRSGKLLKQTEKIINDLAQQDITVTQTHQYPGVIDGLYLSVLEINSVLDLSYERQINLLRHWIKLYACLSVSSNQLEEIHKNLCSKPDSNGLFEINDIQLRVFNGYLYLMEKLPCRKLKKLNISMQSKNFIIKQLGLKLEIDVEKNQDELQFKIRKGGETIRFNNQTKSLKMIYQQQKIPPWERDIIPLVYIDEVLVAVPGVVYEDGCVISRCRLCKYIPQNG